MRQVRLIVVESAVPLGADPVQLGVWLDAVGVEVLIETVVLTESSPMSSVGDVLVENNTAIAILGQEVVYVSQVPQFRV